MEEPLPAGGSCLLGSINLSEFVNYPFTEHAEFDYTKFADAVETATIGLNEVLDEGLPLHPLEEQRESVGKLRQIGLGIMGLADALLKLNIVYGSNEAIGLSGKISNFMLNKAAQASSMIAKEQGSFELYDYEKLSGSKFFIENLTNETKEMIKENGLRNSQLLTIPPCGTISTLLGISGGIEPIFNTSYIRKTETLHDEEVYYKVYTPIVKEFMDMANITDEELLPETFICANDIPYMDRIKMQAAWQKNIDASISSTINLPNQIEVGDVFDIYVEAWKHQLKGITIYRDGCARSGVLITEKKDEKKEKIIIDPLESKEESEKTVCPECGVEMQHSGGCGVCPKCGYSKCG